MAQLRHLASALERRPRRQTESTQRGVRKKLPENPRLGSRKNLAF
jgi:hypothetical protein